tara:strand:+ start:1789 stop:2508 length:720 start_codon:yes stop_codon:yes gene_type:complete
MNKLILILTVFLIISCKSQTNFQKLYSEEMYAESFFSSLNLKTVSSNSFENDILTRYTLTSHLPKDNEELNKIRTKNGMTIENLDLNLKNVQSMTGNFDQFVSSGEEECFFVMSKNYPQVNEREIKDLCNEMSNSLDLFLGNNQLKIFGVHTIVDGEQFTFHNEREERYTKYFSVHMLKNEPDQDLVDKITKTFFQEETLNDVRVIGKNILQCNLKVTYATPPDDSGCNEIEKLLETVK